MELDSWLVCYVEPKKALPLVAALRAASIAAECPCYLYRRRLPRQRRTHTIRRPLISGLFFLRGDHWPLSGFVAGVDLGRLKRLGFSGRPAEVSLEAIRSLASTGADLTGQKLSLFVGDTVIISAGPFSGSVGTVVSFFDGVVRLSLDAPSPWFLTVASALVRRVA